MPEIVTRTAKLFEVGDYPDKGIKITTDALDSIVAGFASIPVKVEHSNTPFDGSLGDCTKIWRDGNDLKGEIGFSPEAWGLIDKAGARKLSIGIKKDLSALTEVSLVKNPRIAGAAVFDDRIEMTTGELEEIITMDNTEPETEPVINTAKPEEVNTMADEITKAPEGAATFTDEQKAEIAKMLSEVRAGVETQFSSSIEQLKADNAALAFANKTKDVQFKLDELKRAGKITPACEPMAREILMSGSQVVTFGDAQTDIAGLFTKFVEALPKQIDFSEQGKTDGEVVNYTAEEIKYAAKLGVKLGGE